MIRVGEKVGQFVETLESAAVDPQPFAEGGVAFENKAARISDDNLLIGAADLTQHMLQLVLRDQDADSAKLNDDIGYT